MVTARAEMVYQHAIQAGRTDAVISAYPAATQSWPVRYCGKYAEVAQAALSRSVVITRSRWQYSDAVAAISVKG